MNIDTKALFYNLYCCYAAKYTKVNNLGTQYLFSNNTLAVFGSTKSGGFLMNSYLYTPLNNGDTLGIAFLKWWSNPLHGPDDVAYSKGNVLLGDPMLTIREKSETSIDNTTAVAPIDTTLLLIIILIITVLTIIGIALYFIIVRKK